MGDSRIGPVIDRFVGNLQVISDRLASPCVGGVGSPPENSDCESVFIAGTAKCRHGH